MDRVIIKLILHNDILDMTECMYGFIVTNKQECLLSKTPIVLNAADTSEDIKLEKIFELIGSKYPNTLLDYFKNFNSYSLGDILGSYGNIYTNLSLQINGLTYRILNNSSTIDINDLYTSINKILNMNVVSCF